MISSSQNYLILLKVDCTKHHIKNKTCIAKMYYDSKGPFPLLGHLKKYKNKNKIIGNMLLCPESHFSTKKTASSTHKSKKAGT